MRKYKSSLRHRLQLLARISARVVYVPSPITLVLPFNLPVNAIGASNYASRAKRSDKGTGGGKKTRGNDGILRWCLSAGFPRYALGAPFLCPFITFCVTDYPDEKSQPLGAILSRSS